MKDNILQTLIQVSSNLDNDFDNELEAHAPKENQDPNMMIDCPGHHKADNGGYACNVQACKNASFTRFDAFTRHWKAVHKKEVSVVCCPASKCKYVSPRADDVKKHVIAKHPQFVNSAYERRQVRNKNYVDPGIYDSPRRSEGQGQKRILEKIDRHNINVTYKNNRKVVSAAAGSATASNIQSNAQSNIQSIAHSIAQSITLDSTEPESDQCQVIEQRRKRIKIERERLDKEEDLLQREEAKIWKEKYLKLRNEFETERQRLQLLESELAERRKLVNPQALELLKALQR